MHSDTTIPDRTTCFQLMEHYQMLPHIREHCHIVSRVALVLARELNKNGEHLCLEEIEAGSLLHDITKSKSIETRENHAETAALLLRTLGYERVAQIVHAHVSVADIDRDGKVTEEEIVNYADKRVMHTTVVSLEKRFKDLFIRYGRNEQAVQYITVMRDKTREIEKKIFLRINKSPDDLSALLPGFA